MGICCMMQGNPKPVLCDSLEGWDGDGAGEGGLRWRGHVNACG